MSMKWLSTELIRQLSISLSWHDDGWDSNYFQLRCQAAQHRNALLMHLSHMRALNKHKNASNLTFQHHFFFLSLSCLVLWHFSSLCPDVESCRSCELCCAAAIASFLFSPGVGSDSLQETAIIIREYTIVFSGVYKYICISTQLINTQHGYKWVNMNELISNRIDKIRKLLSILNVWRIWKHERIMLDKVYVSEHPLAVWNSVNGAEFGCGTEFG